MQSGYAVGGWGYVIWNTPFSEDGAGGGVAADIRGSGFGKSRPPQTIQSSACGDDGRALVAQILDFTGLVRRWWTINPA